MRLILALLALRILIVPVHAIDISSVDQLFQHWLDVKPPFSAEAIVERKSPHEDKARATVFMIEGAYRTQMNFSDFQSPIMTASAVARMKQFGITYLATIYKTGSPTRTIVFPEAKGYYVEPAPDFTRLLNIKLQRVPDGEETMDGYQCRRVKVSSPGEKGEMTVWQAKKLNDFPIRVELPDGRLQFQKVKLEAPDRSLFEVPSGYTQYPDRRAFLMTLLGNSSADIDGNNVSSELEENLARWEALALAAERRNEVVAAYREQRAEKLKAADEKALEFQIKRAAEGSAQSQYDLGLRYWEARGVVKDEAKAFELMEQSAAGGNSQAKAFLLAHSKPQPPAVKETSSQENKNKPKPGKGKSSSKNKKKKKK